MNNSNPTSSPLWVRNRVNFLKTTPIDLILNNSNKESEIETEKRQQS